MCRVITQFNKAGNGREYEKLIVDNIWGFCSVLREISNFDKNTETSVNFNENIGKNW